MDININQRKISIGDKYKIFTDGQQTHKASQKIFRWFAEIDLYKIDGDLPQMTIKRRLAFFKASFDIVDQHNNVYQFRTKSFWRSHYTCPVQNDLYDIFHHKGRKWSIYKNDEQIAWFTKQMVTWFKGDNYTITADNDCDVNLVISFCLVADNYSNNDRSKGVMKLDVGKITRQARVFNPHWLPR